MPKRRARSDDADHKVAVTPSTLAKKKPRSECGTWLGFLNALEKAVGKYSPVNACTETFAEQVRSHLLKLTTLSAAERASAEESWAAGNSVTACGRKVGDRAVVRAACCVLLSDMTKIETSSAGQAKLWAAFPGGPEELLAALGPDVEQPNPAGLEKMEKAIHSCGRQVKRIERIHRVLLADAEESMERLTEMSYTAAARVLQEVKGFGPKLTACVLAFTCNHPVLAVDTNVAKAVMALGWVRPGDKQSKESIHKALNDTDGGLVPREIDGYDGNLRAALHGLLLNLGQRIDKQDERAFVATWKGRAIHGKAFSAA